MRQNSGVHLDWSWPVIACNPSAAEKTWSKPASLMMLEVFKPLLCGEVEVKRAWRLHEEARAVSASGPASDIARQHIPTVRVKYPSVIRNRLAYRYTLGACCVSSQLCFTCSLTAQDALRGLRKRPLTPGLSRCRTCLLLVQFNNGIQDSASISSIALPCHCYCFACWVYTWRCPAL